GADASGEREAGRDGQSDAAHLGEVGALAAEQLLHLAVALGGVAAEEINILAHQQVFLEGGVRPAVRRAASLAVYGTWAGTTGRPVRPRAGRRRREPTPVSGGANKGGGSVRKSLGVQGRSHTTRDPPPRRNRRVRRRRLRLGLDHSRRPAPQPGQNPRP